MNRRDLLLLGALIVLACGSALFLELRGVLLGWDFYALYAIVISVLLSPLIFRRFSGLKLVLYFCFLFSLVMLHCAPWTSRKTFVADLYSLRPGMSIAEVDQRMSVYLKGTGLPSLPVRLSAATNLTDLSTGNSYRLSDGETGSGNLQTALVYRHSTEGRFNGDWGIVQVHSGRVMSISFSMD